MTIRSEDEFVEAAASNGLTTWTIHNCSFCGYPCGFLLYAEGVLYDSGCWCSDYGPAPLRLSSWADVAEHYNRNQPERNDRITQPTLDAMDQFWGFASARSLDA